MRYLAALLDLLLAGCHLLDPGSSPHADASFVIRTEDDAYTIERIEEELRLAVPMALTNRTGQPVYINKCR